MQTNYSFQLEGDKNKLENLLYNNLIKKRDRLTNDLQEVSVEERKNKLETLSQELQTVDSRVQEIKNQTKGINVVLGIDPLLFHSSDFNILINNLFNNFFIHSEDELPMFYTMF